ncbi:hypothetical protein I316_06701 [Kwoniella heveanensis BCC8398]|uniref:SMODS and SLOG-associating 2TM effector domain-containing protein n=1 Tax=Kwoniella heveanensis BCC8398 TaxID=1296120 RepID=A0A1B9GKU5_9TREE|nr:hypothetical protein I316_06701 [Kwoniella heveanensis BCC8398]
MPAIAPSLGVFFPIIPALFSADLGDLLKYAHDRPYLQMAIALALARPLPAVRKAISMSDTMEEFGGEKREDPSRLSSAFRALAESSSSANRHLKNCIHREERAKQYHQSGMTTLLVIAFVAFAGLVGTVAVLGTMDPTDKISKTIQAASVAIVLQFVTGCFSVWDCRTGDTTGTRKLRLWLAAKRSDLAFWAIERHHYKLPDEERSLLNEMDDHTSRQDSGTDNELSFLLNLEMPVTVGGIRFRSRVQLKRMEVPPESGLGLMDDKIQSTPETSLPKDFYDKGNTINPQTLQLRGQYLAEPPCDELKDLLSNRDRLEFTPCWIFARKIVPREYLRWGRLEWIFVLGQSYIWLWIAQLPYIGIVLVGTIQVLTALICGLITFNHILSDKYKDDRLLATIRIHDVVVPSSTYELGDQFTTEIWNTLITFCEKVEEILKKDGVQAVVEQRGNTKRDDAAGPDRRCRDKGKGKETRDECIDSGTSLAIDEMSKSPQGLEEAADEAQSLTEDRKTGGEGEKHEAKDAQDNLTGRHLGERTAMADPLGVSSSSPHGTSQTPGVGNLSVSGRGDQKQVSRVATVIPGPSRGSLRQQDKEDSLVLALFTATRGSGANRPISGSTTNAASSTTNTGSSPIATNSSTIHSLDSSRRGSRSGEHTLQARLRRGQGSSGGEFEGQSDKEGNPDIKVTGTLPAVETPAQVTGGQDDSLQQNRGRTVPTVMTEMDKLVDEYKVKMDEIIKEPNYNYTEAEKRFVGCLVAWMEKKADMGEQEWLQLDTTELAEWRVNVGRGSQTETGRSARE